MFLSLFGSVSLSQKCGTSESVHGADRMLISDGGTSTLFTHHRPVLNSTADGVGWGISCPGSKGERKPAEQLEGLGARKDPTHWDLSRNQYHQISLASVQLRTLTDRQLGLLGHWELRTVVAFFLFRGNLPG